MKEPFFSIVIANYNYGHLLAAALESIIHQDCDDYEIIVVDGGSTDASVDVIKKYEQHIAWWVSEPDKGQSNAFNKGFSHAKGLFYTWLNADDILLPGTLMAVKKRLQSHPQASWATGNFVRFLQENGTIIEAPWGPHYLPDWLQGPGRVTVSFGPTTFWNSEIYKRLGPLDETLHFTMDTDYWCRINMADFKQVRVNHSCWGFRMHEESKTAEYENRNLNNCQKEKINQEHSYIIKKNNYYPKVIWRFIGLFMRFLDGSLLVALIKKKIIVGKKIQDEFSLHYDILLSKKYLIDK